MKRIVKFFHGVKKELGRVRWATKKEMIKYTLSTLGFILFFALFYTVTDIVLAALKGVL